MSAARPGPPPGGQAPSLSSDLAPVVRTGPSGLLLGEGPNGPVTIRLFRSEPTKVVLAVSQYVCWLLTFRCLSMGAQVGVLARRSRDWRMLVERSVACGGSLDLILPGMTLPEAGLPYRPSLIVDDARQFTALQARLGPWQGLLSTCDPAASGAVSTLRAADMSLISPKNDPATIDAMRRAYFLSTRQVKACQQLTNDELLLAMPRKIVKISVRPTPLEYRLLFEP